MGRSNGSARKNTTSRVASNPLTWQGKMWVIARCAVAASILTAAYHMLKDGTAYRDLGPDHFDRRSREVQARRLVRRLGDLGYAVELAPLAA